MWIVGCPCFFLFKIWLGCVFVFIIFSFCTTNDLDLIFSFRFVELDQIGALSNRFQRLIGRWRSHSIAIGGLLMASDGHRLAQFTEDGRLVRVTHLPFYCLMVPCCLTDQVVLVLAQHQVIFNLATIVHQIKTTLFTYSLRWIDIRKCNGNVHFHNEVKMIVPNKPMLIFRFEIK